MSRIFRLILFALDYHSSFPITDIYRHRIASAHVLRYTFILDIVYF